ncbi:MAG: type II CRISPR-associated endonuclease Cas1 [Nitrospirae bacterium]|nr:type II CRISPR-associated endonuclease Cas1 [Nitrospirota bacterium]
MTERIIDISDGPARLSVRYSQIIIEQDGESHSVPSSELVALIVSHPAVTYTHAVLSSICAGGGAFVLCDEKRLPTGMLLPIQANYVQAERLSVQTKASLPKKKQIWKQLIQAKISAQGRLLITRNGKDMGLMQIAKRVRSGDPHNLEAQASRRYWPALFGRVFQRDPFREDQNRLLNYGYAILRAMTARSICAVGLHPSLGVHHHNRYDPFCLAEDVMEPFRPLIDGTVAGIVDEKGSNVPLNKETKAHLISAIVSKRFELDEEERSLFDVMARVSSSLLAVFKGDRCKLLLPEL